jgi:hypothetical protein
MPKKQTGEKKQKGEKKVLTREDKKKIVEKKSQDVIDLIRQIIDLVKKNIEEIKAKNEEPVKKSKATGVKKWNSMNKLINILAKKTPKCLKNYKTPASKRNNNNSGISKPIKISDDLRSFINNHISEIDDKEISKAYDAKKDVSRTFVTKFMCKYVKLKKLQNPDDKKSILAGKDEDFDEVVYKFVPVNKDKALTYFSMQTNLKGHYTKVVEKEPVVEKKKAEKKKVAAKEVEA